MKPRPKGRLAAWAVLLVSLGMICFGLVKTHKVFDAEAEKYGLPAFMKLSDRQLVIDSTFGGVTRTDGKLYSTYDRAASGGKRACPT